MSPDTLIAAAEDTSRREGERMGTRIYDLIVRTEGLMIDIRDYSLGTGKNKRGARGIIFWDEFEQGGMSLFRDGLDLLDAAMDRDLREKLDA